MAGKAAEDSSNTITVPLKIPETRYPEPGSRPRRQQPVKHLQKISPQPWPVEEALRDADHGRNLELALQGL